MSLPTVTQTWTFSVNNSYTYVSVIGATGAVMFSLKNFLKTTMGYTVKGSCDGTTGAMDGVDRITSAASWGTRVSGATSPISWIVITDGAGVDWCFAFNSASDDIVRLSHSTGGNYVAAVTPSNQPTAVDECFDAASGSWVSSGASLNRVWHMWGSSDKKMWRLVVCRNSALVSYIAGEKFTPAIISPATFTLANGGGTIGAIKSFYDGGLVYVQVNTSYNSVQSSDLCRVHFNGADNNTKATIGGEFPGGSVGNLGSSSSTNFSAEKPALQGGTGELLFPATLGSSDGKLGSKIDYWFTFTNSSTTVPGIGDTYSATAGTLLRFVSFGAHIILPWDGVSTPLIA